MAKTFTKIGKQIAIAVKAGGPEPDMNPALRAIIANAKRENMPKDNIERAIKNAMGKDHADYKEVTYEAFGSTYHLDDQVLLTPRRDPIGLTFCPIYSLPHTFADFNGDVRHSLEQNVTLSV